MITPRDEAQIAFYFSAQSTFERSTSGPMLERARIMSRDSAGKRIPAAVEDWHWRPYGQAEQRPKRWLAGSAQVMRILIDEPNVDDEQRDPTMHARSHETSAGVEPDHAKLVAFASASRRMLAVERCSARAKLTLEAYYGARGDGWAARGTGYEAEGTKTPAFGPGRVAALYALTELGGALIAKWRTDAEHMTDDQVLASLLAVQAAQPNQVRKVKLERVRDEAEAMLVAALVVWTKTAPARREWRVA